MRAATHRKTEKEKQLADGGGGGVRGAELYDRKKAWSSINHSILSFRPCHMQIDIVYTSLSQCKCQTGSATEKSKAAKLIVYMGSAGFRKNDL